MLRKQAIFELAEKVQKPLCSCYRDGMRGPTPGGMR